MFQFGLVVRCLPTYHIIDSGPSVANWDAARFNPIVEHCPLELTVPDAERVFTQLIKASPGGPGLQAWILGSTKGQLTNAEHAHARTKAE